MKTSDLLILAVSCLIGCAASGPARDTSSLEGVEDVDRAYWSSWTPVPDAPSTAPTGTAVTFDHWRLDADATADLWSSIFPVLDAARLSGGPEVGPSIELALRVLEPDDAPGGVVTSDVAFVVSARDAAVPWEGVLVRLWRELPGGGSPGVCVLLTRHADGPLDVPSVATIWVSPGYAELAPATLSARETFGSSPGLAAPIDPVDPRDPPATHPLAGAILDALTPAVWSALTQERYIDPTLGVLDPAPATAERFAPPEMSSRDIEQVFSMTAFLPKIRSGRFKL